VPKIQYTQNKLPDFNSNTMTSLARKLWETKMYYEWSRRPLMDIWRQSDDAYLCYRRLPHNEGMQWTDKSDFGSTDVFDGVNMLATRLSLAMMPKDKSWLTVVSRQGDNAAVVEAIQAQQIWMHDRAHTRRMIARHLKQLMVRGTSALYITWENRERMQKISNAEGRKYLQRLVKAGGVKPEVANMVSDVLVPVTDYVGPKIRVLDCLDLYMDPAHDLSVDRKCSTIVATYRRLEELIREKDRNGDPLYSNLDGLEPMTATEIYMKDIEGSNRIRDLNTMGIFPQNQPYRNEGYVPVYICYFPYYEHEGEKFFDTYFHIAESRIGRNARIIRVETPDQKGNFIIKDTMVDWFGNTAYGISLVEKLLSKYNQKQVLEAVTLEASLTSVFPAYNVLAGVARDDMGISFSPGAINEFAQNPMQEKWISPMPVPAQGVQLGMQEIRWWGEQISSGFGEWGANSENPSRNISNRETATAANIKATSGSLAIDELCEKFSVSLQELAQTCYDLSRQEMEPDAKGNIAFTKMMGQGTAQEASIAWNDFQAPRDIVVSGLYGAYNKQQHIMNLTEGLKGIGQLANILPNAAQLAQPMLIELLNKLDIQVPKQAEMDPNQLAASNPQVRQAVLQQLAQQNPQLAAVMAGATQAMQASGNGKPQFRGQPPQASGGAQPAAGRQMMPA
jgi:hypothetical protein